MLPVAELGVDKFRLIDIHAELVTLTRANETFNSHRDALRYFVTVR